MSRRSLPPALALTLVLAAFTTGTFRLTATLPARSASFQTDNLGNLYLIKGNVLEKYDRDGRLTGSFSDKQLGDISFVDATNPLKPIVFYRPFTRVVFLDNTLSLNGEPLRLEEKDLQGARLVCTSHDNGLWVYDDHNSELVRLEKDFGKKVRTGNITQTLGYKPNPNFLTESNNLVYLNDPATGILVFDVFGTYYKTLPLKGLSSFQLSGNNIVYPSASMINSYNTKLLTESSTSLPDSAVTWARTEKERLYVLKGDSLKIYSVK